MQRRVISLLAVLGTAGAGCDIGSLDSDDRPGGGTKPDPELSHLGNDVAGDWAGSIAEIAFRLELTPGPDAASGHFELTCLAAGCERALPGANIALITAVFPRTGSYRLLSIAADGRASCALNPLDAALLDGGDLSSVQAGGTWTQLGLSAEGMTLEFSMSLPFGSTQSWAASFRRLRSDLEADQRR